MQSSGRLSYRSPSSFLPANAKRKLPAMCGATASYSSSKEVLYVSRVRPSGVFTKTRRTPRTSRLSRNQLISTTTLS